MSRFEIGDVTAALTNLRCPCGNRTDWASVEFADVKVVAECKRCGRTVELESR